MFPESLNFYIPIERIDADKREVIGTATAEIKDGHGTIFRYEGSKDAFAKWEGNIREMHQNKAVGRALEITPIDGEKKITVRARISRGAEDTWQKVLDGTLAGFSVGANQGQWSEMDLDGEKVPVLERYNMVELSLVDNPSNPAARIAIARADGSLDGDVLAEDEPAQASEPASDESEPATMDEQRAEVANIARAGARISADTRDALHGAMNQIRQTCGCDDCTAALNSIAANDDNDGDVDANELATMRALKAEILSEVRSQLSPVVQRVNAVLARMATSTVERAATLTPTPDDARIERILATVERIANMPLDGGPVLHPQHLAADKRLATQAYNGASRMSDADVIARAQQLGFAPPRDQESQINAAAAMIAALPR